MKHKSLNFELKHLPLVIQKYDILKIEKKDISNDMMLDEYSKHYQTIIRYTVPFHKPISKIWTLKK